MLIALFLALCTLISIKLQKGNRTFSLQFLSDSKVEYFLFLTGSIFLLGIPSNFKFLAWDELSAWANRSKFLYEQGVLWTEGDLEFFPFYPPILQTLHQIFLPASSSFNEAWVLRTQLLLTIAVVISMLRTNFDLKINILSLKFLMALSIPYFFGFNFYTAYPDLLLGLLFALTVTIVLCESDNLVRFLMVTPLLFFMVLLKPTGVFFALGVVIVFLIRYGSVRINLNEMTSYISSVMIAYFSWQFYTFENNLNTSNFTPLNFVLELWRDILADNSKPKFVLNELSQQSSSGLVIAHKMLLDYVDGDVRFAIPVILFVGMFCVLYKVKLKYLLFAAFFYVSYEILLYFTYINLMSGYEAENTASHSRYLATLFMPLVLICLITFTRKSTPFAISLFASLVFLSSLSLSKNLYTEFTEGQPYKDGLLARNQVESLFKSVELPEKSKLMYLEQNAPSLGYTRLLFAYQAIPFRTSLGCWSWGMPYYDGDIWTCSESGLRQYLELYDYIFVESADENFYRILDQYEIAYDKTLRRGVYQISRAPSSKIKLNTVHIEEELN
jgi:hypothetical protein